MKMLHSFYKKVIPIACLLISLSYGNAQPPPPPPGDDVDDTGAMPIDDYIEEILVVVALFGYVVVSKKNKIKTK